MLSCSQQSDKLFCHSDCQIPRLSAFEFFIARLSIRLLIPSCDTNLRFFETAPFGPRRGENRRHMRACEKRLRSAGDPKLAKVQSKLLAISCLLLGWIFRSFTFWFKPPKSDSLFAGGRCNQDFRRLYHKLPPFPAAWKPKDVTLCLLLEVVFLALWSLRKWMETRVNCTVEIR